MPTPHSPGMAWLTIALVVFGLLLLLGARLWGAVFARRRQAAAADAVSRRLKRVSGMR